MLLSIYRAPADIRCNSPVSALCQLTKKTLPGRDSMGREQREIPGLVWETSQSKSSERLPVLYGMIEHDQELGKNR